MKQRTESSARLKEQPVNSKEFLNKPEEKVRDDELFFYRYFKMKVSSSKNVKETKEEEDELGKRISHILFHSAKHIQTDKFEWAKMSNQWVSLVF